MPETECEAWVFAYGSLMWRPGFPFAEVQRARLAGYHRAFCVYSVRYRGSPTRPGLVLGLDRGGTCDGLAFRLAPDSAAETMHYLRQRELVYGVYRESLIPVTLFDRPSGQIHARAFIAERAHPAYAGSLPLCRQAALIRGAQGTSGPNLDYLVNTVVHLRDMGIRERTLERLLAVSGAFVAHGVSDGEARPRARALAAAWSRRPVTGMRKAHRAPRFVFRWVH